MKRRTVARWLGVLALALLALPAVAQAHGGDRIVSRSEGPYRVALDALAVRSGEAIAAIDYTVYLTDARTGAPVDDARVTVVVGTATSRPLSAHRRGDTYEVVIPKASRLRVRIEGPLGTVAFSYVPPGVRYEWPWRQPVVLGGAALALALYLRAWIRLRRRRRPDRASIDRLLLFTSGVALATLSLISPIDPIGERYLLSVHMLQHVLLGDSGPALILLGLRGPLSLLIVPRPVLRRLARLTWLRRVGRRLLRPAVALALWALVYASWHVPAAFDAALAHQWVHDLEHLSFLIAGLLVWLLLVEPLPHPRHSLRTRMLVALLLFAFGTVLADTLILTPHTIYHPYAVQPERLWGLSSLTDQRLAGAVMMFEQLATIGICLAFLVRAYRRKQRAPKSLAIP
jgi:putative membrane protein